MNSSHKQTKQAKFNSKERTQPSKPKNHPSSNQPYANKSKEPSETKIEHDSTSETKMQRRGDRAHQTNNLNVKGGSNNHH